MSPQCCKVDRPHQNRSQRGCCPLLWGRSNPRNYGCCRIDRAVLLSRCSRSPEVRFPNFHLCQRLSASLAPTQKPSQNLIQAIDLKLAARLVDALGANHQSFPRQQKLESEQRYKKKLPTRLKF